MFILSLFLIFLNINSLSASNESEVDSLKNIIDLKSLRREVKKSKVSALTKLCKDKQSELQSLNKKKVHDFLILNDRNYRNIYYKFYIASILKELVVNKNIDSSLFKPLRKGEYENVSVDKLEEIVKLSDSINRLFYTHLENDEKFKRTVQIDGASEIAKLRKDIRRVSPALDNLNKRLRAIKEKLGFTNLPLTVKTISYPFSYNILKTQAFNDDNVFLNKYDSYLNCKKLTERELLSYYPDVIVIGSMTFGKEIPELEEKLNVLQKKQQDLDEYIIAKKPELKEGYELYYKRLKTSREGSRKRFDARKTAIKKHKNNDRFKEIYKKYLSAQEAIDKFILSDFPELKSFTEYQKSVARSFYPSRYEDKLKRNELISLFRKYVESEKEIDNYLLKNDQEFKSARSESIKKQFQCYRNN